MQDNLTRAYEAAEKAIANEKWLLISNEALRKAISAFTASLATDKEPVKLIGREPTEAMMHAATLIAPTWDHQTNAVKLRAAWDAAPAGDEGK